MASISAQEVAKEVIEKVRNGERPNLGDIIESKGYSKSTSTIPAKVTRTKSYQAVMFPVVKALELERQRIIKALANKDLEKERYKDLIDGLDKVTKNHQLLSGGATDRIVIPISNIFEDVQNSNQHKENSEPKEAN